MFGNASHVFCIKRCPSVDWFLFVLHSSQLCTRGCGCQNMEAVVVVDSDSCASTEIDPESVNSCSDIDDVHQGESDDTTTLRFWRGLTNMAHHIYLVDRIPEITLHLPEPAEAHDISHGTRHIRATLNMGVCEFKIGITCQPANRWSNSRYGYQHTNYSGMNVIYVFESSDDVAAMETALMGCYRYICLLYTSPSPRDQRGSGVPAWG